MCAINPLHKKRMIFDFYTSHKMTEEKFNELIIEWCLKQEQDINAYSRFRCHVKETDQQAD